MRQSVVCINSFFIAALKTNNSITHYSSHQDNDVGNSFNPGIFVFASYFLPKATVVQGNWDDGCHLIR